jgi:hypothetical protein
MAYTVVYEDIVFVEGDWRNATYGSQINCTLLGGGQLKSLNDVKHNLAQQAKRQNYNAVVHFTYGQKTGFFLSFLAWDEVSYWGKGRLANIPQNEYHQLRAQQKL